MNRPSTNEFVTATDLSEHLQDHHSARTDSAAQPAFSLRDGAVRGVSLLTADPELGRGLTEDQLEDARRHAVLAAVTLGPGRWELDQLRDHATIQGEVQGFLVLSGVLMTEVTIASRTCMRLLAPQEFVLIDTTDGSLPANWGWSVLRTAQIAVLDDRLVVIARRWPQLMIALLQRAGRQSQYALLQQAISQLPRAEDRLLALLWSIADRWGIVRSDGVRVDLPLTHETLAQMIGARRPTVTLGLRALVNRGLLSTDKDGWLIDQASLEVVSSHTRTDPLRPAAAED